MIARSVDLSNPILGIVILPSPCSLIERGGHCHGLVHGLDNAPLIRCRSPWWVPLNYSKVRLNSFFLRDAILRRPFAVRADHFIHRREEIDLIIRMQERQFLAAGKTIISLIRAASELRTQHIKQNNKLMLLIVHTYSIPTLHKRKIIVSKTSPIRAI